ncbi:hypothetical protein MPL3365_170054 [Mesorhizobium plurifarium]|uniref:Uncharacterized protein n=1 Tax=Mesorhizobium plurifarium TaxID=69974 RepID=A0A090FYZ6_MESPL|nr:hypothetical protein MPL3365_170054 [Mesorhizobium plurifarium]
MLVKGNGEGAGIGIKLVHFTFDERKNGALQRFEKDKSQIEKFREAARELETDQTDVAFDGAVDKISHAPKLDNQQIRELVARRSEG